jgi:hypothetical protein
MSFGMELRMRSREFDSLPFVYFLNSLFCSYKDPKTYLTAGNRRGRRGRNKKQYASSDDDDDDDLPSMNSPPRSTPQLAPQRPTEQMESQRGNAISGNPNSNLTKWPGSIPDMSRRQHDINGTASPSLLQSQHHVAQVGAVSISPTHQPKPRYPYNHPPPYTEIYSNPPSPSHHSPTSADNFTNSRPNSTHTSSSLSPAIGPSTVNRPSPSPTPTLPPNSSHRPSVPPISSSSSRPIHTSSLPSNSTQSPTTILKTAQNHNPYSNSLVQPPYPQMQIPSPTTTHDSHLQSKVRFILFLI